MTNAQNSIFLSHLIVVYMFVNNQRTQRVTMRSAATLKSRSKSLASSLSCGCTVERRGRAAADPRRVARHVARKNSSMWLPL